MKYHPFTIPSDPNHPSIRPRQVNLGPCRCEACADREGGPERATEYARTVSLEDADTCAALHWQWLSVCVYFRRVPVAAGHARYGLPGYLDPKEVERSLSRA